jgi:hypothetical protein
MALKDWKKVGEDSYTSKINKTEIIVDKFTKSVNSVGTPNYKYAVYYNGYPSKMTTSKKEAHDFLMNYIRKSNK